MKTDKMAVTTLLFMALLLIFIGWAFYKTLTFSQNVVEEPQDAPQKAVMSQAQSLNEARLENAAEKGLVVLGMTTTQVRQALGEPTRIEQIKDGEQSLTVWWYKREGWLSVSFNSGGKVSRVDRKLRSESLQTQ